MYKEFILSTYNNDELNKNTYEISVDDEEKCFQLHMFNIIL